MSNVEVYYGQNIVKKEIEKYEKELTKIITRSKWMTALTYGLKLLVAIIGIVITSGYLRNVSSILGVLVLVLTAIDVISSFRSRTVVWFIARSKARIIRENAMSRYRLGSTNILNLNNLERETADTLMQACTELWRAIDHADEQALLKIATGDLQ